MFNRMGHNFYLNTIQVFWLYVAERSVCWLLSHVQLFATPWTIVHQAPLSMEFSRQEHWRGLPFPSPGDLPHLGIEHWSPALQVDILLAEKRVYLRRWQFSQELNITVWRISEQIKQIKKHALSE